MRALFKGKPAEVWQISKTGEQPDCVKKAFAENYLWWLDDNLRILMAGLRPSVTKNMQLSAVGTVGGGFCGYVMYSVGQIGDFLDATNHRLVSEKKFYKTYQVLEDV